MLVYFFLKILLVIIVVFRHQRPFQYNYCFIIQQNIYFKDIIRIVFHIFVRILRRVIKYSEESANTPKSRRILRRVIKYSEESASTPKSRLILRSYQILRRVSKYSEESSYTPKSYLLLRRVSNYSEELSYTQKSHQILRGPQSISKGRSPYRRVVVHSQGP